MRIGELSKKSGFSKDTIRFYEKLGLIPLKDAYRNKYQFKDYPEAMLRRLLAIREIKNYGFTLQEILGMLILFEEGVLEAERGVRFVQRKIDRIDHKIREMITIKSKLQEIVDKNADGHCPIGKLLHDMSHPVSI
jgi:MerR family copper efflux transcriptional regulator